jgi:hypothetical protein
MLEEQNLFTPPCHNPAGPNADGTKSAQSPADNAQE